MVPRAQCHARRPNFLRHLTTRSDWDYSADRGRKTGLRDRDPGRLSERAKGSAPSLAARTMVARTARISHGGTVGS